MRQVTKPRTIQMRVNEDWLALIDNWRRAQPDLPSRSEAIRRLVEIALKEEAR
jgi:metal-responsive CopG/Arc/MetJ family transcriptional regulator